MTQALPAYRHDLITLSDSAWEEVLAGLEPASHAYQCLRRWQARNWPLVVSRQPGGLPSGQLQVGIPLPSDWGRQRLTLIVPQSQVSRVDAFPAAHDAQTLLPTALAQDWLAVCQHLRSLGCNALVYGSYGWELMTAQSYVRAGSDLDLILPVQCSTQADRVVSLLAQAGQLCGLPRLDGELLFPDDAAIAWREWQQWRSGDAAKVMVKRTRGVNMQAHSDWPEHATFVEPSHVA